jgi:diaminohydroxyphosphoribosylaminopyrimidine deaminase/5-amino-6-(5-phosphoribosylamino)uracil reductase
MHHVFELARKGVALASPGPLVGAAVFSSEDTLVGEGSYTYDGLHHAEVNALQAAGNAARGGTLFINLEPCSHQGRTPPCTDAIIGAGIKRVVVSMKDPNPQVNGLGIAKLKAAGIEVVEGIREREAKKLNEAFSKWIRTGVPLITLKAGMTLDGKIAPPPGESDSPSALVIQPPVAPADPSAEARAHVQELRHMSDAIMVGVGTVIADDPLLTDRTGQKRRRPLMRVILDSRLRLPLESRVVKTCKDDVLVFCSFAEEKKKRELESRAVHVEQVPLLPPSPEADLPVPLRTPGDGRPDLRVIARRLGERQLTSLIIEGGAMVNWAALAAGIVDKVFLYYAPKILAGTGSVPFAAGAGFRRISEAAQVKDITIHRFGEDFAVEGYFRDPYE